MSHPATVEIPVVRKPDRPWTKWLGLAAAGLGLLAGSYAVGAIWGQEGVNHILGGLLFLVLVDRWWVNRAHENLRADVADLEYAVGDVRGTASEALEGARKVNRDQAALVRAFYGEDEPSTGRHAG